ncbi:hypothetical protein [Knoellia sinensis]|nr:hypothetical protein [Knoellia sinensis]
MIASRGGNRRWCATAVLGERLRPIQQVGVVLALAGAAIISL